MVFLDVLGYTAKAWRESPLIHAIQLMPDNIPIVTNEPAAVLFLTGREAIWVSESLGRLVDDPRSSYGGSQNDLGETVFRNGGALVLFKSFYWNLEPYYGNRTWDRVNAMLAGLIVYKSFGSNSGIYFYKPENVPGKGIR
jgi:hypothetical protein